MALTDGLVSYWRFDENGRRWFSEENFVGEVIADHVGNNPGAVWVGNTFETPLLPASAQWVAGPTSPMIRFPADGANWMVRVNEINPHNTAGTIGGWARLNATPAGNRFFFSFRYGNTNTRLYFWCTAGSRVLRASVGDTTHVTSVELVLDEVVPMALVWGSGQAEVFVNGVSAGSFAYSTDEATSIDGAIRFAHFGRFAQTLSNYYSDTDIQAPADLSGWGHWNRKLTPAEIAEWHGFGVPVHYPFTGTLSGTVTKGSGGPADLVSIHDYPSMMLTEQVIPAENGAWAANVPDGDYMVAYLAAGCEPVLHGPYTVGE